MRIRLTIIKNPTGGEDPGRSKELSESGGTIGRSPNCDLVLWNCEYVSRVHARIKFAQGRFYLFDTSINGIFLNEASKPVGHDKQVALRNGDQLQIGEYCLVVEIFTEGEVANGEHREPKPTILNTENRKPGPTFSGDNFGETGITPCAADEPTSLLDEILQESVRKQTDESPREKLLIEQMHGLAVESLAVDMNAVQRDRGAEAVDFAVFGPRRALPGSAIIIDVWAYCHGGFKEVEELAAQLQRDRVRGQKAGLIIARGTTVSIDVSILDAELLPSTEQLTWQGQATNVSFFVTLPENSERSSLPGIASLSIDGVPVGNIVFLLDLSDSEDPSRSDCEHYWLPMKSAFASYASVDRADVLARLQGIRIISPLIDIFLDVLSLRAGDDWAERLRAVIPAKDRFLLFWSKAAAASEWVEREWRIALEEKGLNHIVPVPIQDPRLAPPPEELNELHFSDSYLAHIAYEISVRAAQREKTDG